MASVFKDASILGHRPYDKLLSLSHAIFDVLGAIEPSHPHYEISREKICECLNAFSFRMGELHSALIDPIQGFDASWFSRIPSRHEIVSFQDLLDSMFKTGNGFTPLTRIQVLLLFEGYNNLLKGIEDFDDEDDYLEEPELDELDYAQDWEADHEHTGYTDDEN